MAKAPDRSGWSSVVVRVRRVYEPPQDDDGARVLIDRLWPRGLKRESLHLAEWIRDLAPSDALRNWFKHDPKKWDEFRRRYFAELDSKPHVWKRLLEIADRGTVTLLYSAKDTEHNNAIALREYLARRQESGRQ